MSTRSDLKENLLASRVEAAVEWIVSHRIPVLITIGVLFVGLLILSVVSIRRREARDQAATRLAQVQQLISAGRAADARLILNDLLPQAPGSMEAIVRYYAGVAAIETQDYAAAIPLLNDAVRLSGKSPLTPLALSNLGFAQEENGEAEAAARTYQTFLADYADHFLAARVQLALGRSLVNAGQREEAKKAFEHLIDLYPTSEWAEKARTLMDKNKVR